MRPRPVRSPSPALLLAALLLPAAALPLPAGAQDPSPRFGLWELRSDAPPPARNLMRYEPWGDGGMRVTVAGTTAAGRAFEWSYVTLFDGVFRPVDGQEGADTAVEFVDARTTRITNRRDGRVTQVILNTLSDDGRTIRNEYVRMGEDGKIVGVAHAVYDRVGEEP